ncbi:FAD-binding oxidoreductase [Polyangium jinanense]|uniref:FAD-binding oxidoreductase n=1 Tax=Polyangium jinanense TaxID=2829994 RepID=A0A9X4AT13_9BACT|nr:FAD-binding oxidoreductase [Polyangium jinanense]MDC3961654.1 FAD-binding oxidoreductase [Polyangium jinanense]MDC3983753.1 FAD-binding oxidoreductase [Polyangium jinanense]
MAEAILSAWGRLALPGVELLGENLESLSRGTTLSRGMGRSYGDSSLPARGTDRVVSTRLANRILAFDARTGVVRAEAGMSLVELNRLFVPRGFFPPVTPGTKFVTLGGMVASDVHGKNHHREGCFGAHVRSLRMRLADDSIVTCSPTEHADLFHATIGGMGLLGHILEVEFTLHRIPSPWIFMESERVRDIDEFLAALGRAAPRWPMTMGWIDCLHRGRSMGRGILMAGRWAEPHEAPKAPPRAAAELTFPVELPNWALNPATASLFNMAYYWRHTQQRVETIVAPEPFFYPLDAILDWNRVYGPRGFTQYQCVLPRAAGPAAVREFMELLTRLGGASPLCVIKDCGPEGEGLLSFPLEGTSIAVDMAISPDIQRIVDRLNEFVIAAGGRIYLTKDRFTRPEHFRAMEPRLERFLAAREKWDPHRRLRSAQSVRLFGDRA